MASNSLALTPDQGLEVLKRPPAADRIEKFYVEIAGGDGWLIHNVFREKAIHKTLTACQVKAPAVQGHCPPPAPYILSETPPKDRVRKVFFPDAKDPQNGWWLHNQFREEAINLELHRCEALKSTTTQECQDLHVPEKKPFYRTGVFTASVAVLTFVSGFFVGYRLRR